MDGVLRIPLWRASSIMGFVVTTFRFHNYYFQSSEMCDGIDDETLRGAVWEHCKTTTEQLRWREGHYVPRLISKNIVILHLFSGERRAEDLQSFLSDLNVPSGHCLTVLSVDIIYDSKSGDLSSQTNQERWFYYVRSGCVAIAYAGPPCETWSRARQRGGVAALSRGDGGPRVLRSPSQPEGFDHLTIAEAEQLLQANRLLLFTLRLFMLMTYAHRLMVMEHPILPAAEGEEWLPSIWRLYAVSVYNLHSAVTWVDLFQGHYGGRSPKPTTLLVSCGPTLDAKSILESYRSSDLPSALVMGRHLGSKEYSTQLLF